MEEFGFGNVRVSIRQTNLQGFFLTEEQTEGSTTGSVLQCIFFETTKNYINILLTTVSSSSECYGQYYTNNFIPFTLMILTRTY